MLSSADGHFRIDPRKLSAYLLDIDHAEGGPKARFLLRHGFLATEPEALARALVDHPSASTLPASRANAYARKSIFEGPLTLPDGTQCRFRTVWRSVGAGMTALELVTAYPIGPSATEGPWRSTSKPRIATPRPCAERPSRRREDGGLCR